LQHALQAKTLWPTNKLVTVLMTNQKQRSIKQQQLAGVRGTTVLIVM